MKDFLMTKFKMIRETGNNFNINFSLFSTQIPSLETLFLISLSQFDNKKIIKIIPYNPKYV